MEIDKSHDENTRLRAALEQAQAAMWDAYYGHGITLAYVQSVDAVIFDALRGRAISAVPA